MRNMSRKEYEECEEHKKDSQGRCGSCMHGGHGGHGGHACVHGGLTGIQALWACQYEGMCMCMSVGCVVGGHADGHEWACA